MRGRHPILGKELLHRQRIAVRLRLCHYQLCPGNKRPEKLPYRDVKTARCFLRHHIIRGQRIVILHPQQTVNDGGLPNHHPFWSTGRTGSKNDIGSMIGLRYCQRSSIFCWQGRVIAQTFQPRNIAKARQLLIGRDQQFWLRVFEHHPQAIVRVSGIQRQPGCTGFNNTVQRQRQEHGTR